MQNNDMPFDLAMFYTDKVPDEVYHDFHDAIVHPKLRLVSEKRSDQGAYAGVVWLLPTAVILWIGKSYFNAFLSEAGKDHYQQLKLGMNLIWRKLFGKQKVISIRIVTSTLSPLKAANDPYSPAFSVVFPIAPNARLKFLFPSDIEEDEFEVYFEKVATLARQLSSNGSDCLKLMEDNKKYVLLGQLIMAYDAKSKELIVLDPMAKARSDGVQESDLNKGNA